MKKTSPFPITETNFQECWEYVDKHRRTARKKAAIAKIGRFSINLLFLWMLIFIACGLLYKWGESPFREFWEWLFLFPYWEAVSSRFLVPGESIFADIGRLASVAYLLSAATFLLLAVVVRLLYHPIKKKLPEGTYAEKTELLAKQAQDARNASNQTRIDTSVVASVLAVFTLFGLLMAYAFYTEDAAAITELLGTFPTKDYQSNSILYVLILYCVCDIVCTPLLLVTLPIYHHEFPYDLVVEAERTAFYAREDLQDLTAEELAEKRAADAVKLREEALELEKQNAYGVAKRMLLQAAICSDVPAMEHYARHCLLSHMKDSAKYWLKKAVASGNASKKAKRMLLRLRLRMRHKEVYLRPDEAPLSTGKKILLALWTVIKTLWKLLMLAVLIGTILLCAVMYQYGADPSALEKLPPSIVQLLTQIQNQIEDFPAESTVSTEETLPYEPPVLTLTDAGTPWENNCVAYAENGNPMVYCYSKASGGDLEAPCPLGTEGALRSAASYYGNKWDIRTMIQHATYYPETQTVVIAAEYLQSLAPGEYFIILNDQYYLPLLISE